MLQSALLVLPLILIFLAGYAVKRAGFMNESDGATLLKLVYYIGAPALIITSILKVDFEPQLLLWIGLAIPAMILAVLAITNVLRRTVLAHVDRRTFGSLVVGSTLINVGFLIPFVERLYGAEGLARLMLVDAFLALTGYGLVYIIAVRYGSDKPDYKFIINRLALSPPIWALVIALVCKFGQLTPPELVLDALGLLTRMVGPTILIALGLKFVWRIEQPRLLFIPLVLRFALGALVGIAFVRLLGLEGLSADIAILVSLAPIGFNTITFAELENLNTKFAAAEVSAGIMVAMVLMPFVIHLLR